MYISGELKIHKSDGVTKAARKAKVLDNGELAVWEPNIDDLPNQHDGDPDIIVSADMWERVEREGSSWRDNITSLVEQAKERDDVDVEDIKGLQL